MKKFLPILVIFCGGFLLSHGLNAQVRLYGTVRSAEGPLPFATLGIAGKTVGTISNEYGQFELSIPDSLIKDSLTISYVGYEMQKLQISVLVNNSPLMILMKEQVESLDDFEVRARRIRGRQKTFGAKKKQDVFFWITDGGTGSEIARLIDIEQDFFLQAVSAQIENDLGQNFTLLVNIYRQDPETGLPGAQLLKEIKVVRSNQREGWLEVDMRDHNLSISGPFYVSFQWTDVEKHIPMIAGKADPGQSYVRLSPLGEWQQLVNWNINAKGLVLKD